MLAPAGSRRAARVAAAAVLAFLITTVPAHAQQRGGAFDASRLPAATAELMQAAAIPPGFTESVAFSGLDAPTAVRFASDGRVVVAEKSGVIKQFDGLSDSTPTVIADLRTEVHNFWDRGLLGLALDPNFASNSTLYVLYAYNKQPGNTTFPRWPSTGCPTPPGATDDGCVISGRLSRISATGVETPLIEDWCQQYPSHSIGSLAFGADGALYVSGGDGASFNFADYGTDGNPINPCGDPPGGVGGSMTPPTAEGGALRSQDIRTSSDPTGLDGAILRLNPATGAAMAGNANIASPDLNTRRIIAAGLRNPFRFTIRPGTNEVWIGDVGWSTWEEIDRIVNPTAATTNFGWPCYEGNGRQPSYDNLNLNICENLYTTGDTNVTAPYYTYNHSAHVVSTESCPTGGSSISGLAFTPTGSSFGTAYDGSLFFADYSRNCIWVMRRGTNGLPDPTNRQVFVDGAAGPVDLQFGPGGGDLYYVDMNGGTIRRIRGSGANQAPTAVATATPTSGAVPLSVSFDGRGSTDPDGDTLTYAWDLDGDGQYDDSTSATPSFTYTTAGVVTVGLRVSDPSANSDTTSLVVTAGTPPTATITSPAAGTTWVVGDTITFSGSATDFRGVALPASSLSWHINLQHCSRTNPSSCHTHVVQSLTGSGGSFVAPDHEYPSHLELQLTATDSFGLTRTVTRDLNPKTVPITVQSQPAGVSLTLGSETATAPFTFDVIQGSHLALTAPTTATVGGNPYDFTSWSDGGARTHEVVAGSSPATYTATFTQSTATPSLIAGTQVIGATGSDAQVGQAEVYRTTATGAGRVTSIGLRLAPTNTATSVVLGLYSDVGGVPTTLLASGRIASPQAGAWNEASIDNGPILASGTPYWIALLNPTGGTGVLRWHDRAGGTGGPERGSASGTLGALPTTWATGASWSDGPLSAYVMGVPAGPPALAVSPGSLAFSATAGSSNPASKTLSVSNTGGGTLSFTASDDASWLTVTPASGAAPATLTAAVDTAGLTAGTYNATVRVDAAGASGAPKLIPVTLTLAAPQPPALSVTPGSLAFNAVEGAAAPAPQSLAIANTGGGTLSFTTSDDQSWLAATPASGTAPAAVSVSVTTAGLTRGTYTGSVRVTAGGATGSPVDVPVTLNIAPPSTGLVGAWGFDEATGTTAGDSSGSGNIGTISGATRTTGKYGGALSFDGVNDWVTVPDANSLDVNRMTLEAWVRPSVVGNWRTVLLKEQPGQLAYALYASTDNSRPSGHVFTTADMALRGSSALTANTWSHLAFTWDGATSRIYVNGTQVASAALTGTAATSASSLRIGGNSIWGEWFSGAIDEVRIYNRALSAAEVAADRDTPIVGAAAAATLRAAHAAATSRKNPDTRRAKRAARRTRHAVHCGTRWLKRRHHAGPRYRVTKACRQAH
jgi:glucose/arabinose dehydrogenase